MNSKIGIIFAALIIIFTTNLNIQKKSYAADEKTNTVSSVGFSKAKFIVKPEIFLNHKPERNFIGPGMIQLEDGKILMAAPWGRPPTNFEQLASKYPVSKIYFSLDGGRTWKEQGRMDMKWDLAGMISDGGVSFLQLKNGQLAFLANRHVKGLHGGGLPVISFSHDQGKTWSPAKTVGDPEGVWYLMNDRLIQTSEGRLIVPVAHMPKGQGVYEGDVNISLCFYSDDNGKSWNRSKTPARLEDKRGMAEPAVVEISNHRLLMISRTGSGFHYASYSKDGGENWSIPEATSLQAACSSLTLKTLPDGRLIVFYNHTKPIGEGAFFPRSPLCYAISSDEGKTWSPPVIIDADGVVNKDRQNIYPSACFTKEGILLVWSTHRADPKGTFSGAYDWRIGGGKRAIIEYPK